LDNMITASQPAKAVLNRERHHKNIIISITRRYAATLPAPTWAQSRQSGDGIKLNANKLSNNAIFA
jgi:hypothetical protein